MKHTVPVRQPRFRIPVDGLQNLKQLGCRFVPPRDDFRDKLFRKWTLVLVETREKLFGGSLYSYCHGPVFAAYPRLATLLGI